MVAKAKAKVSVSDCSFLAWLFGCLYATAVAHYYVVRCIQIRLLSSPLFYSLYQSKLEWSTVTGSRVQDCLNRYSSYGIFIVENSFDIASDSTSNKVLNRCLCAVNSRSYAPSMMFIMLCYGLSYFPSISLSVQLSLFHDSYVVQILYVDRSTILTHRTCTLLVPTTLTKLTHDKLRYRSCDGQHDNTTILLR